MQPDYFAILGLAPGRYDSGAVQRRFFDARRQALALLDDPHRHTAGRQALDAIHLAYAALRDPATQQQYLKSLTVQAGPVEQIRRQIRASLEDGLLRFSRRQEILTAARAAGLSDFHAQILIAEVQFGGPPITNPLTPRPEPIDDTLGIEHPGFEATRPDQSRAWARAAAAGVLALAMFVYFIQSFGPNLSQ